jgi:hypothetical protein
MDDWCVGTPAETVELLRINDLEEKLAFVKEQLRQDNDPDDALRHREIIGIIKTEISNG